MGRKRKRRWRRRRRRKSPSFPRAKIASGKPKKLDTPQMRRRFRRKFLLIRRKLNSDIVLCPPFLFVFWCLSPWHLKLQLILRCTLSFSPLEESNIELLIIDQAQHVTWMLHEQEEAKIKRHFRSKNGSYCRPIKSELGFKRLLVFVLMLVHVGTIFLSGSVLNHWSWQALGMDSGNPSHGSHFYSSHSFLKFS